MPNYDFSTLNSSDLEELVCDLLNADQPVGSSIKYKTFKDGKDKGIDLLYSTESNIHEHVGQVKHYYRTGFTRLLADLKSKEVDKVKKLKSAKYIFATSVDLNVAESEAILKIFSPFIKNGNDIYGKKDLNRLLAKYEKVGENHFKLWFHDTSIIRKILASDLFFRSLSFSDEELKRKLRIYVKTPLFDKSRDLLAKNKFIIITGEPGIGKTSLAEMLVAEYIKNGYDLTYIYDDIKDAESALTTDDCKQVIYFDDFLGSNEIEINKAKGSETTLIKVLKRINTYSNKIFVLTTRGHLLASAIESSGKFKLFNIRSNELILDLSEYSNDIKVQLFKNHVEDSYLNDELKNLLATPNIENFILTHENFSPRSIEFITNFEKVNNFSVKEFEKYIYSSFNSPIAIWEDAYQNQIKEDDKLLINTLFSFSTPPSKLELKNAFHNRIELEINTNNKIKSIRAFESSFNRLYGGFITENKHSHIVFINPSIDDFLLVYLSLDSDEVLRIVKSIIYISQFSSRIIQQYLESNGTLPVILKERLLSEYSSFITEEENSSQLIILAYFIFNNINSEESEDVVCDILKQIVDWDPLLNDYSINIHFREFLNSTSDNTKIRGIIEPQMQEILIELISGESDAVKIIDLLEKILSDYQIDISPFKLDEVENYINELINELISDEIYWLEESITDTSEASEKRSEIELMIEKAENIGLKIDCSLDEFDSYDWYEIACANDFRRMMENDD